MFSIQKNQEYDVIVIGAGLSGLAAAIRLQQAGKSVLVLEKTDKPGGRAKKTTIDGSEFEIGCNQLGKGILAMMEELGVKHEFIPLKNRFVFTHDHSIMEFPITETSQEKLSELPTLLLNSNNADKSLQELTRDYLPTRANILRTPFSYFLMTPSENIDYKLAKRFLINSYGYDDPRIPAGGMSALIESMINRFKFLGGVIQYNSPFQKYAREDDHKMIIVKNNAGQNCSYITKDIISSVGGWDCYPQHAEPGLSIGSILFKMDKDFRYPEGIHTIVFVPDNIDDAIRSCHQGDLQDDFAFHCFVNQPASEKSETCHVSVYLLWPRNANISDDKCKKIQNRVIDLLNQHMPDFKNSIIKQHFFPPSEYIKSWGHESIVIPRLPPKNFKLYPYNQEQDIYYVGNAVNKAHEQHIEGALKSSRLAVNLLLEKSKTLSPACKSTITNKKI